MTTEDPSPMEIRQSPVGFGAVLHLELLTVDPSEHQRILDALASAGYVMHVRAALLGPDEHGVMGGRWTMARDLYVQRISDPQPPQPPQPPEPPTPAKPSHTVKTKKRASKKRSTRKGKR